jgi:glycosyltransferase involved in cell wall biosynthesis
MTLLQVTNRVPYPLTDGGAIAIFHVTKHLHLAGYQVIMASLNTQKHFCDPAALKDYATVYTSNINTDISFFSAFNNFLFSELPYNIQRFLSEDFSKLLINVVRAHQPDIIQLEGLPLCLYVDLLKSITKAPIILRAHNVEFEIWQRLAQNEKNIFKKFYLKHLAKRLKKYEIKSIQDLDGIIAISSKDAENFRKLGYRGPIITVPVGVSEKWLNKNMFFEEKITKIGYLGSLEWLPNVQGLEWFLQNIWSEFNKQNPDIQLHIAGKNPLPQVFKWKYPNVVIHGEVPDAVEYLQNFSVVIVPLLSGSGIRLKIVESMALGKCVISTSIGAEGIDIQDNQNIVIANSPVEWIQKLSDLIADAKKAKEIGTYARKFIQAHYRWEYLIQQMQNFYQQFKILENA